MAGPDFVLESDAAVFLLFGGAVGLLVSVLVVSRVLVAERDARPGRRALAHWSPVAVMGVVAALLGHPEIGLGVAFGTSVAALSTIVGFLGISASVDVIPPRARRIWSFLPVVTTLAFVVGFRGQLTLVEAIILAAQGALAMLVWDDPGASWEDEPVGSVATQHERLSGPAIAMAVAALLLTAVAAWAATRGAEDLSQKDMRYPTGLLASTIISVVLIMPMIGTGVPLAADGKAWSPITAQVGLVFLNLCLLVPLVIVIPLLMAKAGVGYAASATMPATMPTTATTSPATRPSQPDEPVAAAGRPPLLYPRTIWRIDAVTLLLLSLVLLPIAMGRFKLDKQVAGWLIVAYCVYLLSVLIVNARGI